jgi:hypothetical protein
MDPLRTNNKRAGTETTENYVKKDLLCTKIYKLYR